MAHYAFIGYDNKVAKVIVGVDETVTQLDNGVEVGGSTEAWEQFYQNQPENAGLLCKRTSYNAATNGYRGKYAGIGDIWNGTEFVAPVAPEPVEP